MCNKTIITIPDYIFNNISSNNKLAFINGLNTLLTKDLDAQYVNIEELIKEAGLANISIRDIHAIMACTYINCFSLFDMWYPEYGRRIVDILLYKNKRPGFNNPNEEDSLKQATIFFNEILSIYNSDILEIPSFDPEIHLDRECIAIVLDVNLTYLYKNNLKGYKEKILSSLIFKVQDEQCFINSLIGIL